MTMQQMNNGLQHRQANGHPTLMRTLFGLGSLGLFLISIVDSSVVPLPIPGSTDILLVLLAAHHTNGILLVLCATVGSLIGGYSSYQIGKRGGLPALERYLSPKYLKQVCSWVERHTLLAVALPFHRSCGSVERAAEQVPCYVRDRTRRALQLRRLARLPLWPPHPRHMEPLLCEMGDDHRSCHLRAVCGHGSLRQLEILEAIPTRSIVRELSFSATNSSSLRVLKPSVALGSSDFGREHLPGAPFFAASSQRMGTKVSTTNDLAQTSMPAVFRSPSATALLPQ